ncbi:MAG TPA: hypothetical protein VIG74_01830 [Alphaproteobacteria bacterium]|jgi:hypothetical protein
MTKTNTFIAAALCGLSAIFCGAAQAQDAKLFSTPETAKKLGWIADKIPQWASMDVLVATPEDIDLTDEEKNRLMFAAHTAANNEAAGEYLMGQIFNPHLDRLIDSFPSLKEGAIGAQIPADARKDLAYFAGLGMGGTRGIAANGADAHNFCIIVLPPYDAQDARDVVEAMTAIPPEDLAHIPGTAKDWKALIAAHETQHCHHEGQNPDGTPLDISQRIANETMADQASFQHYFLAYAEGNVTSPDVPAAFAAVRALRVLTDRDRSHATHINLNPARAGSHPIGFWENMVTGMELDAIYKKIDERIARDLNMDMEEARKAAMFRPKTLYRTVAALNRENAFADSAATQAFISYFLISARIHAPEYFGVDRPALPGPAP